MSEFNDFYRGRGALVWESAAPPRRIPPCYGGKAIDAIEATFGPYPITLTKEDLKILRAMVAVGAHRPIGELVQLVEEHGSIRVWMDRGDMPASPNSEENAA